MTSEMRNERFICYTATHLDSGLIYIGITSKSLNQRKQGHKDGATGARKGAFSEAIRSFGIEAFTWNVVAEGSEDVIRLLERLLIYEWDTANPAFGYNERGGAHPAQIRYQLKKESWKHFGPPWNQPMPEEEAGYLEFEQMMDESVNVLDKLNDIEARIGWIEANADNESVSYAVKGWAERLNDCKASVAG